MQTKRAALTIGLFCLIFSACSSGGSDQESATTIKSKFAPGELTAKCNGEIATLKDVVALVTASTPTDRTFDSTLLRLESALATYTDQTTALSFMAYVSPDSTVAAEGADCEANTAAYLVSLFTDVALYDIIRAQVPRTTDETRLQSKILEKFEDNGLNLPAEKLAQIRDLKSRLATLESEFSANLNNGRITLEFSRDELAGLSEEILASLEQTSDGNFLVSTNYSEYLQLMQNAVNNDTRRQMLYAYVNRAAEPNTTLLEEAIEIRRQIATLTGFSSWADYKTYRRMAGSAANVTNFLNGLKGHFLRQVRSDLATLSAYKQSSLGNTNLKQWDLTYLMYQLKKQTLSLNDQEIRQYFPIDQVLSGLFELCDRLFGIEVVELGAEMWSPDVRYFQMVDKDTNNPLGYFYLDLFPREGKYSHAATFTLTTSRLEGGKRVSPISAIVVNVESPTEEAPALLTHDSVVTLFHEFGHLLNMTLSSSPYVSTSILSAPLDFIEVPSQTFQNWAWEPQVLEMISGRYSNPEGKLPSAIVSNLLASRHFQQGVQRARQLETSYMDINFHTAKGPVDVTAIADRMYSEFMGISQIPGAHEPATIGHLMGGYDAGYYSYYWSEVYASDIFAQFQKQGIFDRETGNRYREWILAPGNTRDSTELLRGFLGREPSSDAFLETMGIQ